MTNRRTVKRNKSLRRNKRRVANGGGWSDLPAGSFKDVAINPGNPIHFQYSGYGMDCTGNPMSVRPGYIFDYTSKGLPGLSGGKKQKRLRGGVAMPTPASTLPGPVPNPNLPPVSGSLTPKPDSFPDTTGAGEGVPQVRVPPLSGTTLERGCGRPRWNGTVFLDLIS